MKKKKSVNCRHRLVSVWRRFERLEMLVLSLKYQLRNTDSSLGALEAHVGEHCRHLETLRRGFMAITAVSDLRK